jgi:hypothetical protein
MSRTIFTETRKWVDSWFHRLSVEGKLLFFYFLENADHAGFIEVDIERIYFETSIPIEHIDACLKEIAKCYERRGNWIWLPNYLKYQRNDKLNPNNNSHKGIIRLIEAQEHRFKGIWEMMGHGGTQDRGSTEGLKPPAEVHSKVTSSKVKYSNPSLPSHIGLTGEEIHDADGGVIPDSEAPF